MEYRSSKPATLYDIALVIKIKRQRRYDKFLSLASFLDS